MESPLLVTRLQVDKDLQQMLHGTVMRKVKSKCWKKQRTFKLQEDGMTIWYQSRKTAKNKSTFSISDIEAVREGHQSEMMQSVADEYPPERCFTIVFSGRQGNLDLVANSAEEAQFWIQGIRKLIETVKNMNLKELMDQWIWDWFVKGDKNKDGRMNFKEARNLLKMMNVYMNEKHAYRLFQTSDKSQSGTLEGEEFVFFYKALTQRDDIVEIFMEFSKDGKKLTLLEFVDFLKEEQLEKDGVEEYAMQLIARYEPSETAKKLHAMSYDGFLAYLLSPEGAIFNHEHRRLYQDMSHPLCHYFISSSHNTYLIEDQLRGQSSVEGYIRALRRGCRCLELDTWDGPNGEPMIYHGYTLTSKILFKDVVSTIDKYAFQNSEYPIILSLENHCSVEQQDVLAYHLKNILGEKLLTKTIDGHLPTKLPSPEELRGKILLKGKKFGGLSDCLNGNKDGSCLEEAVSGDEEANDMEEETAEGKDKDKGQAPSPTPDRPPSPGSPQKSKVHISQALSDCVIYCKTVSFVSFKNSATNGRPYEMSSFPESKARKLAKEAGTEFVCYNARQLCRIYPSGLRTDSSNYHPQDMWNVGCQMVALNFQTAGTDMDLCDGLFKQNANCGYVLKPRFLRCASSDFNPEQPKGKSGFSPVHLDINVISAQQLPKDEDSKDEIVDPLVRVEIYGIPADHAKHETKHIDNNGFNPIWNETLKFKIHVPKLAMVRFVVEDYDIASKNDFIAQYTLPFTSIKSGYRHIHLLSKDGNQIPPASLFVHIKITQASKP
ncbi:1-phosphatidylinositol 4,5-bisphosphate phosphodiesterase delta-4 [Ambystoma mexicanum]|uniref:1-phosphatidylinositol 4,5-bisphosphate phosphodiesterase delta-4 n=1 Tax=Ambystoma mexicanum TaxID=8296 RepID=UPI0037E71D57